MSFRSILILLAIVTTSYGNVEEVADVVRDVIAKLNAANNTDRVYEELARAYAALEDYEHTIDTPAAEICRRKLGLKENEIPKRGSNQEKCLTSCGFEQEGYWKDGRPYGITKVLKALNAIVIRKFPNFDTVLTREAKKMQLCYAIERKNDCAKVYDIMRCLRASVDDMSTLISDRLET